MEEMREEAVLRSRRDLWVIPGAIIVAGLILAFATYAIRTKELTLLPEGDVSLVRPVSEEDHIIGNPAASVVIIEYADIDSNYAKDFQAVMQQVMTEYAPRGEVAWAYRHLPLVDQHPNSKSHAEAAECVAFLGGEDLFWRFIDNAHAQAPRNQQLSPDLYESIVSGMGIRPETFNDCMNEHRFARRVEEDFENGLYAGADGSPFSVVLIKGHPPMTIDGSVPYEGMKRIIEEALKQAS